MAATKKAAAQAAAKAAKKSGTVVDLDAKRAAKKAEGDVAAKSKKAKANLHGKKGHNSKPKERRDSGGVLKGVDPRTIQLNLGDAGPALKDFKYHFDTIAGFKAKVDAAMGFLRNAYKQAESAGIKKAIITDTMKWKKDDPAAVKAYFTQLKKSFDANGVEVQVEMFDASGISRGAQIYDGGFKAGTAGKALSDSPFAENSPEFQLHARGWHAGQQSLMVGQGTPTTEDDGDGDDDGESD